MKSDLLIFRKLSCDWLIFKNTGLWLVDSHLNNDTLAPQLCLADSAEFEVSSLDLVLNHLVQSVQTTLQTLLIVQRDCVSEPGEQKLYGSFNFIGDN